MYFFYQFNLCITNKTVITKKVKIDVAKDITKKTPTYSKLRASLPSYLSQKLYNKHNKFVNVWPYIKI